MPWLVLVASAVFEAVWATALGRSDGLSRLGPSAVFAIALVISMLGLGWAARSIPIGTAYSVWVGIGAALTVSFAIGTGAEEFSGAKVLFIAGIIGTVVGLRLVPARGPDALPPAARADDERPRMVTEDQPPHGPEPR